MARVRATHRSARVTAEDEAAAAEANDSMRMLNIEDDEEQVVPEDDDQHAHMRLCMIPVPDQQSSTSTLPKVTVDGAAREAIGPPIGSVDIGTAESAYYFRVSLPGVRKDAGQFSCEIEHSGRVQIRGTTATIRAEPGMFAMRHQNLCSSGPFTLAFFLPGPVDNRMFVPTFVNGIFEGVVLRADE